MASVCLRTVLIKSILLRCFSEVKPQMMKYQACELRNINLLVSAGPAHKFSHYIFSQRPLWKTTSYVKLLLNSFESHYTTEAFCRTEENARILVS